MVSSVVLLAQVALAISLGVFFALERRLSGDLKDWRALGVVLGAVAALSAIAGNVVAMVTTPQSFDYLLVMGVFAFGAALLGREMAEEKAQALNDAVPVDIEVLRLASTIWIGAACGIGDVRGCIFVLLLMALASICRPQRKPSEIQVLAPVTERIAEPPAVLETAFSIPARAPDPSIVLGQDFLQQRANPAALKVMSNKAQAYVPAPTSLAAEISEGSLSDAAGQLRALATILRGGDADGDQGPGQAVMVASNANVHSQQPLAFARRAERLPNHNVAARLATGHRSLSNRCVRKKQVLQRQNFRVINQHQSV